ncbi:MAG TPA: hypothetical protein PLF23_18175, partial [Candidatus Obscuribacter sp.]|nr:hypothetical protein [Candidatus Obscuribacter sp.]
TASKLSTLLQQVAASKDRLKAASSLKLLVDKTKISVVIQLTIDSEDNIKALKRLGLELILQEKNRVIGKVSPDILEKLCSLKFVKQVTEHK